MKNQNGIIHLGILGLLVLLGGLFLASKMVSNPNLTFFNIAEEAKGIGREECRGCSGDKQRTWDWKNQVCVEKKSAACLSRLPTCERGTKCATGSIPGSKRCQWDNQELYCCDVGEPIEDGWCATARECFAGTDCSDSQVFGSTKCYDKKTASDKYCCGRGLIIENGGCHKPRRLNLPECEAVCGNGAVNLKSPKGGISCRIGGFSKNFCCPRGTKRITTTILDDRCVPNK